MTKLLDEVIGAKAASIKLSASETAVKNKALRAMAAALDKNRKKIIAANAKDIKENPKLSKVMVKRLMVDDAKIDVMIEQIKDVVKLEDPVGETMSALELDTKLMLYQVKCPIGVIGVIFESRPDVVPQIMSLCLKSGNAVIFKGGSEAYNSNLALFEIMTKAAYAAGIPKGSFVLLQSRDDVKEILKMDGYIDLLIPRGSGEFVKYIQDNTKITVLGHAGGICHVYVDEFADLKKAVDITIDSKTQYPAVCNAAETLLVHKKAAKEFLPMIDSAFEKKNVEARADERARKLMKHSVKAKKSDWGHEFGDTIMAVAVVDSMDEAIDFINANGTHHTDTIVTKNRKNAIKFSKLVDSADIMINASTRFSDGYRFGKGAEVGISTNKIHSRGPMGMEGLTIYKYVVVGDGQIVEPYASGKKKFKHVAKKKEFGV